MKNELRRDSLRTSLRRLRTSLPRLRTSLPRLRTSLPRLRTSLPLRGALLTGTLRLRFFSFGLGLGCAYSEVDFRVHTKLSEPKKAVVQNTISDSELSLFPVHKQRFRIT